MEVGLNNHLKRISSELFIKEGSIERLNINRSLKILINKMKAYFDDNIDDIIVFGSYTRGTILPRMFDENSDIDILVQFNTDDYDKLKPESYRSRLKKFAQDNYPRATVIKDHPSIVIELNHIKFDLVPSIFDEGLIYDSIEIPDKDGGWLETEPDEFNQKLTKSNMRYNSIVKPIVRLLKYWNASHRYPFASFELEKIIADMSFRNDNFESGFIYAALELPKSGLSYWAKNAINALRDNAEKIEDYLEQQQIDKAKQTLGRILPGF